MLRYQRALRARGTLVMKSTYADRLALDASSIVVHELMVVYLGRGSEVLEKYNLSLAELLGVYVVGGIVGGFLVGVFLPVGRTALGAAILGSSERFPSASGSRSS